MLAETYMWVPVYANAELDDAIEQATDNGDVDPKWLRSLLRVKRGRERMARRPALDPRALETRGHSAVSGDVSRAFARDLAVSEGTSGTRSRKRPPAGFHARSAGGPQDFRGGNMFGFIAHILSGYYTGIIAVPVLPRVFRVPRGLRLLP